MRTAAPAAQPTVQLARKIGVYAATAVTVGDIVGSGIFRSPHVVAQHLASVPLMLVAWVVGGLLSICGALVMAELAVGHPRSGGLYVFLREAFGDVAGFVFGWAHLWVIKPTLIASIATVFTLYFCQVTQLPEAAQFSVAAAAILLLTGVNWLGVTQGAWTQSLFTTIKVIGIAGLCLAAFVLPASRDPILSNGALRVVEPAALGAFAVAMIAILFAYDGWADSTYVAGEVINPQRTLPIAIVWGTWLVIAIYVATNAAYAHVLGAEGIAFYPAVGAETMRRVLGGWGARALAVLVAVSTFGTTNGSVLTGSRVTQAMAADGLMWPRLARLDPKRGTPGLALWVQAACACAWLLAANSFEDVSGWFVTTVWLFYALAPVALFARRRRERAGTVAAAAYRTPFYPLTPAIFGIATVLIIANDLHSSGWRAAAGLMISALGFPIYYVWKRRG